jgi:hypothetical protein
MPLEDAAQQRSQLQEQRRKVDFDSYDITVEELVRRVVRGRIEIAPAYQRQFRWDAVRQSRLIESLLLGIPIPPLFFATNIDEDEAARWEVVDGLQRLLTLVNFVVGNDGRQTARLHEPPLELRGLEILQSLEGRTFDRLPADIRDGLLDRPMKVIVLNDKSDLQVRFDLFERLNTGGIKLTPHEVRESVYMGAFVDLLSELTARPSFGQVVVLPKARVRDGTPQDYILRFFAFHERYRQFEHSVQNFLNDFCRDAAADPQIEIRRATFNATFAFLADVFPTGLRGRTGTTPVNLYEGISVGAAFALDINPFIRPPEDMSWIKSEELRFYTTGPTNDRSRVTGRIEFCRDRFLAEND